MRKTFRNSSGKMQPRHIKNLCGFALMMKYYIDTSIWRDYYENRADRFRPLGEWAFELFKKIKQLKDMVLFSTLTIEELSKDFDEGAISKIFRSVKEAGCLGRVEISQEQRMRAAILRRETGAHFSDALHAIVAADNGAIMVTRDAHFNFLRHIVEVKKPEELI